MQQLRAQQMRRHTGAQKCSSFRRLHGGLRPRGPSQSRAQQQQVVISASPGTVQANEEEASVQLRYGYRAEQGLRPTMEDALHVDSAGGYLYAGCYDGHGGTVAVQWMKANLLDALKADLQKQGVDLATTGPQAATALARAFQAADQQILAHLEHTGGEDQAQSGSTATVLFLWRNRVLAANVGDSQAYLWRKGGLVPLTVPHRVYGTGQEVEDEVDRVKATGGWVYDGRVCNVLAVSRAFGDWEFKGKGLKRLLSAGVDRGYWPESFASSIHFTADPVIVTPATADVALTPDDEFLVLSTDGLWDVMPPRDAMQWARKELQKGYTPQEVAESLVNIALKRYTSDNTSVVVVDLKGPDFWGSASSKQGGFLGGLFGGFGR